MPYHKNQVWLIGSLSCLLIFSAPRSASYGFEDVIDLGETGFSSPLQSERINKDYSAQDVFGDISQNINFNPINLSFKSALAKHSGLPLIRHLSFKKNLKMPTGAKIFIFSCYDQDCIKIASTLNFDYGLCIDYDSLSGIRDFKEKIGLNKPVQIADDQIASLFKISSYPALITIKENEFEIQEGF